MEGVPIAEIAKVIQRLRVNLTELEKSEAGSVVAGPLRDRITQLTRGVIGETAKSGVELASKASLLLYWIDPVGTDIPHLLSASLCRDVLLMFPGEP